jgi:uncharacterized protein YdiU (UPF0061 family)
LGTFPVRFETAWSAAMRWKLGLAEQDSPGGAGAESHELVADLLATMQEHTADYTGTIRSLSSVARGEAAPAWLQPWTDRWRPRLVATPDELDRRNPARVPRNHLVEEALAAATAGDLAPFHELLAAVTDPFTERPELARFAGPAPIDFAEGYRTFCGT